MLLRIRNREISFSVQKGGVDFRVILRKDANGNLVQYMEKPDLRHLDASLHVSGAHIIANHSKQNHYDHYGNGQEWKEYGHHLQFRAHISGNRIYF